jgi:hypothetical protein
MCFSLKFVRVFGVFFSFFPSVFSLAFGWRDRPKAREYNKKLKFNIFIDPKTFEFVEIFRPQDGKKIFLGLLALPKSCRRKLFAAKVFSDNSCRFLRKESDKHKKLHKKGPEGPKKAK